MDTRNPLPESASASPKRRTPPFEDFRRLLWRVIGKLARKGYYAQPADASDLIHDFYEKEWASLTNRFDASRASFEAYVFKSFYRFARRRIVRLAQWAHKVVDVDLAHAFIDGGPSVEETLDASAHVERLAQALERLPGPQRKFLNDLFVGMAGNERALARTNNVSRYHVRKELVLILDQLSAEGDTTGEGAPLDLQIVESRSVAMLLSALYNPSNRSNLRKTTMNIKARITDAPESALALLRRALVSGKDESLLRQVNARATEILSALEETTEEFSEHERARMEKDPEWLAVIYETLGAAEEGAPDEHDHAIAEAIATMHAEENKEIALAFDAMIEQLPNRLLDWDTHFYGARRLTDTVWRNLLSQWEMTEMHPAAGLLRYGISPGTIFDVTEGVSMLLRRTHDARGTSSGVRLSLAGPTMDQRLLAQIRATPGLESNSATLLLAWLREVAEYFPHLFGGYRVVENTRDTLHVIADSLHLSFNEAPELYRRWSAVEVTQGETVSAPAVHLASTGSFKIR